MTDHTDLKRYKYGYSSDEWGMGRSLGLIPDPAGNVCLFSDAHDKLEAAQAEIDMHMRVATNAIDHVVTLKAEIERQDLEYAARGLLLIDTERERDAALARIAKLEPKRNVSPPSEELVLHKMRYHFWEADDDEPADFELFDAGVECDTCIDVALVRQDRLDELIAAGASPQPSQDLSLDLLERLSKTLTRLGYATPEGGMEHFNADLANQLYNLCRAVDNIFDRVQPSQAVEHCLWARNGHQPCQHTQPAQRGMKGL